MARHPSRAARIMEKELIDAQDKIGKIGKNDFVRYLMNKYPDDFTNFENTRGMLKSQTGATGRKTDKTRVKWEGNSSHFPIPKSSAERIPNYEIKAAGKYLVFSDVHLPYHDEEALRIMFQYTSGKKYKGIIINGDLVDNYKASRFLVDYAKPNLKYEYEMTRQFLKDLKELYNTEVYYKFGNHDERVVLYMLQGIPELAEYVNQITESIFRLNEIGIHYIKSHQMILLGKLAILHGHEFPGGVFSPVNPARGLFMKAKGSAIVGHHHQTSEHSEGNIKRETITCWSLGCLCDLNPAYNPLGHLKWNHGFAEVEVFEDGTYHVDNHRITKGKVV